jgi:hypothetical protein
MIPPALDFPPESFQLTMTQKLHRRNIELSLENISPEDKDRVLMELFDAYCVKENICNQLVRKLLHHERPSGTIFNQ